MVFGELGREMFERNGWCGCLRSRWLTPRSAPGWWSRPWWHPSHRRFAHGL